MAIKTSDIIQDDGAIKKVVSEMAQLEKQVDNLIAKAIKLNGETNNLNATNSEQRNQIKKNAEETEQIANELDKYNKLLDNNAIKLAALKKAQSDMNKINKLTAETQLSQYTSLNNLNAQLKLAQERYKQLTKDEKDNTKEGQKLESQISRLTARINEQKKEQRESIKIRELELKVNKSAEGSYNKLSAQYSLMKIQLNKLSAEERANTKAGQEMENQAKELYEEMKRLQSVTGKNQLNVGNYKSALEGLPGPLGTAASGVSNLRGQLTKLAKHPVILAIAAIVGALALMYKSLKRSEEGQDALNRVLSVGRSIFDNIADIVTMTATALLNLGKGFDEVLAKIRGFRKEVEEDAKAAIETAERRAKLNKAERAILIENARLERDAAKLRAEAEELKFTSTEEAIEKLRQAGELENKVLENELSVAKQRASIRQAEADLAQNDIQANNEIASLRADIYQKEQARDQQRIARLRELKEFQQRQREDNLAILEAERKESEIAAKDGLERYKQDIENEKYTFDIRLAQAQEYYNQRTRIIDDNLGLEIQKLQLQRDLELISEERYQAELSLLETSAYAEREEAYREFTNNVLTLDEERAEIQKKILEDQKKQAEQIKEGYKSAFSYVKQQLQEFASLRRELADQSVEDINNEISSLENRLQVEIENRNAGYANQVATVQKELELQKKAQRDALENRKKAQQQELIIQSLEQASNLVTAAAKINAQVGFPASVPLISLMLGSFIATKAKAFQLTRQEFSEGDYEVIGGGRHGSGNDTLVGISGNKAQFAEQGEARMILKRSATQKYKSQLPEVWQSLNNGIFEDVFIKRNTLSQDIPIFNAVTSTADMATTERELKAIRKQGESRFDGKIRVYKNHVTRYVN